MLQQLQTDKVIKMLMQILPYYHYHHQNISQPLTGWLILLAPTEGLDLLGVLTLWETSSYDAQVVVLLKGRSFFLQDTHRQTGSSFYVHRLQKKHQQYNGHGHHIVQSLYKSIWLLNSKVWSKDPTSLPHLLTIQKANWMLQTKMKMSLGHTWKDKMWVWRS